MLKHTILLSSLLGLSFLSTTTWAGHDEKPHANPWSNFALENKLKAMPKGDVQRGKEVHNQMMCASCHGEFGQSPSMNYASLNGQSEQYTVKMMLDYQDGRRWETYKQSDLMVKLAQAMNDQQIADVAAFYAAQQATVWSEPAAMNMATDKLVRKGDASRMIVPCASCHGAHGEGNGINPALAGQVPQYFIRTLNAYKEQHRTNDVAEGMSQFTHDLTAAEIESLAHYYARLNPIKTAAKTAEGK